MNIETVLTLIEMGLLLLAIGGFIAITIMIKKSNKEHTEIINYYKTQLANYKRLCELQEKAKDATVERLRLIAKVDNNKSRQLLLELIELYDNMDKKTEGQK